MSKYLIPILFILIFILGFIKKVKPYDSFCIGSKSAIPFVVGIFPNLLCIFLISELMYVSGISDFLSKILAPFFNFFGIPIELSNLVLIKPFSGSGALGTLSQIYSTYGVDSYVSRCASVIYGSSETVFYIASVYFSKNNKYNLFKPIVISLIASFFSIVFGCFICKII